MTKGQQIQRLKNLSEAAVDRGFKAVIEGMTKWADGPAGRRAVLEEIESGVRVALRDADAFEAAANVMEARVVIVDDTGGAGD